MSVKIPALALALFAALGSLSAAQADTVRIALGDIATVETLGLLAALENARARGLDIEVTEFSSEEIGNQAVISGQADIGIGTPYAMIQKVKAPIRIFFQLSKLVFFPVVDKSYTSWQDLDGQPFTFHARGTGTEAMGDIIAAREGIEFGERSYVPGSEVRGLALLNGNIKATILDLANTNLIMKKAADRFHVLPGIDVPPSDEVMFAREDWLQNNAEAAQIIVEELLKIWRQINDNPASIAELREKFDLLPDLPPELEAEIVPFYTEGAEKGLYPVDGGSSEAAMSDFDFYGRAGQLEGDPATLQVEDYWDLTPLENAKAALDG